MNQFGHNSHDILELVAMEHQAKSLRQHLT